MPSIRILLKRDIRGDWRLYAPKGHDISGPFRGNKYDAYDWAVAWCSTWKDWSVDQQDEDSNETEENRVP